MQDQLALLVVLIALFSMVIGALVVASAKATDTQMGVGLLTSAAVILVLLVVIAIKAADFNWLINIAPHVGK